MSRAVNESQGAGTRESNRYTEIGGAGWTLGKSDVGIMSR